ncbi:hypothetical protein BGL48_12035 [Salinivibrio sp. SS3]|uniref:Uncharacterized protein n=1 Tax=Salinivibrio phage SMHB1 TaxID=1897436 RepID=A0A1D9C9N3_9CAUD|nr:hypothetical protein [Salinivibrio sp. BNH]YP_009786944.1 hypothetical protein HOR26_gp02 [Salinivibrio phage SMHB1]AOY11807.1 hypothetical protein [Salinivibrio phage SMHB1]ODP98304.1 hypothetical protein BGL48_12035 [Salinivibrio sp. BNH]
MNDKLDKFLREREEDTNEKEQGVEIRKEKWLEQIERILAQIEGWFNHDKIHQERVPIVLSEELIGDYSTQKLVIEMPNCRTVTIEPEGCCFIGVNGAFKVKAGSKEVAQIQLTSFGNEDDGVYKRGTQTPQTWKICLGVPGAPNNYQEFDKDNLTEIVMRSA